MQDDAGQLDQKKYRQLHSTVSSSDTWHTAAGHCHWYNVLPSGLSTKNHDTILSTLVHDMASFTIVIARDASVYRTRPYIH